MSSDLTPRLSTSKTWTDLPLEFTDKVIEVFKGQFEAEAARGEFLVEGRVYPDEIIVRVGYLESGRLKQFNIEASMDRPKAKADEGANDNGKLSTMERLYTCIDAVGSVMEDYFDMDEEDELEIPLRWKEFKFDGEAIFLQQSSVNTKLEEEADRILGLLEKNLVMEAPSSEDALGNAEIDNELAFDIQKAIRSGNYKTPSGFDPESGPEH